MNIAPAHAPVRLMPSLAAFFAKAPPPSNPVTVQQSQRQAGVLAELAEFGRPQ